MPRDVPDRLPRRRRLLLGPLLLAEQRHGRRVPRPHLLPCPLLPALRDPDELRPPPGPRPLVAGRAARLDRARIHAHLRVHRAPVGRAGGDAAPGGAPDPVRLRHRRLRGVVPGRARQRRPLRLRRQARGAAFRGTRCRPPRRLARPRPRRLVDGRRRGARRNGAGGDRAGERAAGGEVRGGVRARDHREVPPPHPRREGGRARPGGLAGDLGARLLLVRSAPPAHDRGAPGRDAHAAAPGERPRLRSRRPALHQLRLPRGRGRGTARALRQDPSRPLR